MPEQLSVLAVKKQRHSIAAASAKKDELGLTGEGAQYSLSPIVSKNHTPGLDRNTDCREQICFDRPRLANRG